MNSDDFREQLLHVKKAHSLAVRENVQYKTRLRVAERECRRREAEIERMLSGNGWPSPGGSIGPGECRIELAALKRRLLLYERMLQEKGQENARLAADKGVVQAAETRKMMAKLEGECQRLRAHLAQSVPESELLREKDQYLAVINRLVEENMHLRTVIGQFEQHRREAERLLAQLGGGEALVRQFRRSTVASRRQANFYRNALGNLLRRERRARTESVGATVVRRISRGGLVPGAGAALGTRRRRASVGEPEQRERERKGKDEREEERERLAEGGAQTESGSSKRDSRLGLLTPSAGRVGPARQTEAEKQKEDSSPPSWDSPADDRLSPIQQSDSSLSTGRRENGEEEGEVPEGAQRKDTSTGVQQPAAEETEGQQQGDEEMDSHTTALFRLLQSHVLRLQMVKVRREREPPPPQLIEGMHLF